MSIDQKKQFWIVSLVTIVSLLGWVVVAIQKGAVGFPLDDGWIHQTYARNLAQGSGWVYSAGQPSAGATAPLWVLLLIPGYWISASPLCWVLLLGLLQMWGLAWLATRNWSLLSQHSGWWLVAAGLAIGLEWHLLWAALSGMETLLMAGLVMGVLVILLRLESRHDDESKQQIESGLDWRWFGIGALVGLGIWIRPEAVTLFGPVAVVAVLSRASRVRTRLERLGLAVLGGLSLFIPYLAFNRWLAGAWWPNTFFAKQAEYAVLREASLVSRLVNQPIPLLIGVGAALLPGFLYDLFVSIKDQRWGKVAGAVWVLGFIALYAVRLPVTYQHGRYLIPIIPVLVLWGLAGTAAMVSDLGPARLRWLVGRFWGAIIATLLVLFWGLGVQAFTRDVAVINGEMVTIAGWIEKNTQQDDLIAAHDIGAIGYFTEREIVDLAGLISPDVIPFIRDEARLANYLDGRCPDYLVTFPSWYPELVENRKIVFQTDAAITREFGKDNMAVYIWDDCIRE